MHIDEVFADATGEARLAERGKAHQLVFPGVDLEARMVGERGIEHAQRMREMHLAVDGKGVAPADRPG